MAEGSSRSSSTTQQVFIGGDWKRVVYEPRGPINLSLSSPISLFTKQNASHPPNPPPRESPFIRTRRTSVLFAEQRTAAAAPDKTGKLKATARKLFVDL